MKKEFTTRINLDVNLNIISKLACKEYSLGTFISNSVLYFGYGDFNYKLHSSKGTYVVKVINKEYTDAQCNDIVCRYVAAYDYNVNCPKIYKTSNGNSLLVVRPKNTRYRLFVMQYLPYKNLYKLNYSMSLHDFELIGEQLALINKIDYNPTPIYDSWAIQSLTKEYSKFDKSQIKDSRIKTIINSVLQQLKQIDYSKLPNAFIHGDVVDMNVLKTHNTFYIVDFSSANYQIRICDLATTIADMCYQKSPYKDNIDALIKGYSKHIKLQQYELQTLPLFVKCAAIIGYLNCIREQTTNGGQYNKQLLQKYTKIILLGETNEK